MVSYDELRSVIDAVENRASSRLSRYDARPQARPGSVVDAIVPTGDALGAESLTWGFDLHGGNRLVFNTRIESALGGSRMWVDALRDGRCIVPAATFFEPHATETERNPHTGKLRKRQYEFASEHDEPLLLASIQQHGRLSIVTTEPNPAVAPIHNRMPLILRFEEVPSWFEGDIESLIDRTDLPLRVNLEYADAETGRDDNPESGDQLTLF